MKKTSLNNAKNNLPISGVKHKNIKLTIEKVTKLRSGRSLGNLKIRDLIKDGRKY